MRLHILSDIHLEHAPCRVPQSDADIVILAGDIAVGTDGVHWAKETFQRPVIYVCGNHEYHNPNSSMAEHLAAIEETAEGSNVILLDNKTVAIDGIRFLGSTMWTDLSRSGHMLHCDYDNIVVGHETDGTLIHFTVEAQQELFERNRKWLRSELSKPYEGKTVVVTHHAPSPMSLHQQYVGYPWNDGFITDLEELMSVVDVWVHGHTHNNFDYCVGRTRIVCNPRGYPSPYGGGWENQGFDSAVIVEA